MWLREGSENSHFRNALNFIKNFRETKSEPLVISKRLKFPEDDRTDKTLIAPFRISSDEVLRQINTTPWRGSER